MGKMFVVYKIYLDDPEQMDSVCEALKKAKTAEFKDLKREPVGFGIEVLKVGYLFPEKQDELVPRLEEEIKAIPGITEIETEIMTLV